MDRVGIGKRSEFELAWPRAQRMAQIMQSVNRGQRGLKLARNSLEVSSRMVHYSIGRKERRAKT